MATSPKGDAQTCAKPENCTKYFDALWFCYSPVFQLKQYYIYGNLDNCQGHWNRWYQCLKQRTAFKDKDAGTETAAHPLWQFRTKEEAQHFWEEEFGHLAGEDALPERRTSFFE